MMIIEHHLFEWRSKLDLLVSVSCIDGDRQNVYAPGVEFYLRAEGAESKSATI
jgi:hypothetical protein